MKSALAFLDPNAKLTAFPKHPIGPS